MSLEGRSPPDGCRKLCPGKTTKGDFQQHPPWPAFFGLIEAWNKPRFQTHPALQSISNSGSCLESKTLCEKRRRRGAYGQRRTRSIAVGDAVRPNGIRNH